MLVRSQLDTVWGSRTIDVARKGLLVQLTTVSACSALSWRGNLGILAIARR